MSRSLWIQNGRQGKLKEWPVGIVCVCARVVLLVVCVFGCVSVYDVAEGGETQSSGRPDSRGGERERQ